MTKCDHDQRSSRWSVSAFWSWDILNGMVYAFWLLLVVFSVICSTRKHEKGHTYTRVNWTPNTADKNSRPFVAAWTRYIFTLAVGEAFQKHVHTLYCTWTYLQIPLYTMKCVHFGTFYSGCKLRCMLLNNGNIHIYSLFHVYLSFCLIVFESSY